MTRNIMITFLLPVRVCTGYVKSRRTDDSTPIVVD